MSEDSFQIPEQDASISKDNWPDLMIALYREGRSDMAVCNKLGIQRRTFDKHYRDSEKFRDLVEYGRACAESWWEEEARANINNKNFNTGLFKAYMGKHYGWGSKNETTITTKTETDIDKLKLELSHLLPEMIKLIPTNATKLLTNE